jgi:hypothetical protein
MKQSKLLFLGGAFTILLIVGFCGMIIWAFLTKDNNKPWPPTKEKKDSVAIEIKEVKVPVNVYVHDTVTIKIPCRKQHCEIKTDTAQ